MGGGLVLTSADTRSSFRPRLAAELETQDLVGHALDLFRGDVLVDRQLEHVLAQESRVGALLAIRARFRVVPELHGLNAARAKGARRRRLVGHEHWEDRRAHARLELAREQGRPTVQSLAEPEKVVSPPLPDVL